MKQNLYSFLLLLVCSALAATVQAQTPSFLKGAEVQAYNANTQQVKQYAQIAIGDEMANLTLTYKQSVTIFKRKTSYKNTNN